MKAARFTTEHSLFVGLALLNVPAFTTPGFVEFPCMFRKALGCCILADTVLTLAEDLSDVSKDDHKKLTRYYRRMGTYSVILATCVTLKLDGYDMLPKWQAPVHLALAGAYVYFGLLR